MNERAGHDSQHQGGHSRVKNVVILHDTRITMTPKASRKMARIDDLARVPLPSILAFDSRNQDHRKSTHCSTSINAMAMASAMPRGRVMVDRKAKVSAASAIQLAPATTNIALRCWSRRFAARVRCERMSVQREVIMRDAQEG